MSSRKRSANEPLLPSSSPKQPRTKMVGYDGRKPSPSEDVSLLSRWRNISEEFRSLTAETLQTIIFPGQQDRQKERNDAQTMQSTPSSSVRSNFRGDQRSAGSSQLSVHSPVFPPPGKKSILPRPPSSSPLNETRHFRSPGALSTSPTSLSLDEIPRDHNSSPLNGIFPPRQNQDNGSNRILSRKYVNREHIYSKAHKAHVRAETLKSKEEMMRTIYTIKRRRGYKSTFTDFESLLAYQAKLESLDLRETFSPSSSMVDLHAQARETSPRRHSYSEAGFYLSSFKIDDMAFLKRALDHAKATLNEPQPPRPFQPTLEQLRLSQRRKDEKIEQLLRPKPIPPTPLPPSDDAQVDIILKKRGVISKYAREQVNDTDLSRLRPAQWLNDEIINFYGALISGRSDDCKENPSKQKNGMQVLNVHYFSTFFWAKLKEGYEKGRLAKWTKKVDIFSKDVVLVPVNHSNAHWTSAAINFRQKRIESYDSMGTRRDHVFKALRAYLDAEHRNKKKTAFDFTGWQDYSLEEPQQENGYDCGVFTCQFLQGLSRGDECIRFTQQDMPALRRRMIWEIAHAQLRDEP